MIADVISIEPTIAVKELLKLLTKHNIGGIPVVDNENKLVNMISDGDVLRYIAPKKDHFMILFIQYLLKKKLNKKF